MLYVVMFLFGFVIGYVYVEATWDEVAERRKLQTVK